VFDVSDMTYYSIGAAKDCVADRRRGWAADARVQFTGIHLVRLHLDDITDSHAVWFEIHLSFCEVALPRSKPWLVVRLW